MADYHLPPTATPAEVSAAIRANGFVIVDNLVSNQLSAVAGVLRLSAPRNTAC